MRLIAIMLILALSAGCGSGQGNQSAIVNNGQQTVTGTAALGDVTAATVYLKDVENSEVSAVTLPGGSFSLDTTGMKKPYLMKAVFTNATTLYSVVPGNGAVTIDRTSNRFATIAATGLKLAEVYLYIKASVLVLMANKVEVLARRLTA